MPTHSSDTGVTYASASSDQYTSTLSLHGVIWMWRRIPHRRWPLGDEARPRRADRRVQSVGGGKVAGAEVAAANRIRVLTHLADLVLHDLHARLRRRLQERCMQSCPAHAAPGARSKRRGDAPRAVEVADPVERFAFRGDAEVVKLCDRVWHQPFPAGLVDWPVSFFDNNDVESGPGTVQCGGQAGRAPAGHEQIDHRSLARAAFSTLIRALRSAAFSTANATAVIHAVCTNGSAIPSTTTAT